MFRLMIALTNLEAHFTGSARKTRTSGDSRNLLSSVGRNSCSLSWTLARTDPNRTVAQCRTDCELPLDRALSMSDQILDTIEKAEPECFLALNTLFSQLGRMGFGPGEA